MKLSFSTKGWHGYSFDDFCRVAEELHFAGIELHNIKKSSFAGNGVAPFAPESASATVRSMIDRSVTVPCIDSVCDIADISKLEENCAEIADCITTAANLRVPYVRVHTYEQSSEGYDLEMIAECLRRSVEFAEERHVTILIETVGVFADTSKLRDMLNRFASDGLAALWNMHYPYRIAGESPETTIDRKSVV